MDLYFKLGFLCCILTFGLVQSDQQQKHELGDLRNILQQYLNILKKGNGANKDANPVNERTEGESVGSESGGKDSYLNKPIEKDVNTEETLKKGIQELKAAQKYIQEEREKLEHEKDNIGLVARLLIDILEGKDGASSTPLDAQRRRRPCPGCPGR
ncbi:unnamed protein product [Owenia fusiformis]|uniref:Uncharacterized protein n=1 Tax=Owenia fusiformis TaxID=6347 RepID=A0A8J1Y168_OWEFU|nr:unnamed protein product [Owenia fusiformis]